MEKNNLRFLADYLLRNIEHEFSTNIKVLSAVPEAKKDYKPDSASKTAAELALHLASGDIWFLNCIVRGSFAGADDGSTPPAGVDSIGKLVAWCKKEFPASLEKAKQLTDAQLAEKVDFMGLYNIERVYYFDFLLHHSIHHRGQLSAYLRAMGGKVPSIYGGSYDEPMQKK